MITLNLQEDDYRDAHDALHREERRCTQRVAEGLASMPEDEALDFSESAMSAVLSEDDDGGLLHDKLCACYLESARADLARAIAARHVTVEVPEIGDAHAAAAKAVSAISELDDAIAAAREAQERAKRMVAALGRGELIDEVLSDIENAM